ncbi:MAG TPA: hypothetical protein ENO22_07760 [candidate division Zixibacteria bacterium]|nr:hypothetical protein [candidate division Zixibacteria bacterium]HEQ99219.1 hypothetical protein [candidate division Zixibacteria bacterium]
MSRRKIQISILTLIILILAFSNLSAQWEIDLEFGPVFNGYNDVQIPNETGTRFSLTDDLSVDPDFFFRTRVSFIIDGMHVISGFAAPLRLDAEGSVGKEILFEGTTFPANTELRGFYRFDSYRLTYRYNFIREPDLTIGLGFTAKVRDAEIRIESEDQIASKTNTGFVPLINFRIDWLFAERFGLLFAGDALAAPQGRAEDVILALKYHIDENLALKSGYRILEGGADVDDAYTFALLHYISFGLILSF